MVALPAGEPSQNLVDAVVESTPAGVNEPFIGSTVSFATVLLMGGAGARPQLSAQRKVRDSARVPPATTGRVSREARSPCIRRAHSGSSTHLVAAGLPGESQPKGDKHHPRPEILSIA